MAILLAALTLVFFAESGTRLEQLKPVELLYLEQKDNMLILKTDGKDLGRGNTLEEAIGDLKNSAAGKIFLETTDKIVITEKTIWALKGLQYHVRPAAQVFLGTGVIEPETAAKYLSAHDPGMTLGALYRGEGKIPVLRGERGRYRLEP